jgi:hypothetical protein
MAANNKSSVIDDLSGVGIEVEETSPDKIPTSDISVTVKMDGWKPKLEWNPSPYVRFRLTPTFQHYFVWITFIGSVITMILLIHFLRCGSGERISSSFGLMLSFALAFIFGYVLYKKNWPIYPPLRSEKEY